MLLNVFPSDVGQEGGSCVVGVNYDEGWVDVVEEGTSIVDVGVGVEVEWTGGGGVKSWRFGGWVVVAIWDLDVEVLGKGPGGERKEVGS